MRARSRRPTVKTLAMRPRQPLPRQARLGSPVQSKAQYLGFVEDLLRTASHIPAWAIAHTENGFISSEEMVDKIGRVRKVSSIYTKDFSDLLGVRASLIVAS